MERFFPLLLAVFVLAGATLFLAWRAVPARPPALSRRMERVAGDVLLALAIFLVAGQHLRPLIPRSISFTSQNGVGLEAYSVTDAGSDQARSNVPIATATGVGLFRRASWAPRVVYPLLAAYTLLGVAVTAMGLVMR